MATFDLGRVTPLYKGDYSASTSYELNDVVLYNGNLYWHIQATATVGILPTDTTVWKLAFADEGVRAEIRGYADNAQASADSALASKSAAATSASNASASASQAALSAQSASTKASEASTSAQTASTKASEASTSAQSAASSAQTAMDNATLASQKAQAASESASLATAKASAASTSETNAAASAQTASAKASEAAASATSAQEYDESAQASAVNAQTAQGLAEQARTGAETAQGLAEDARDEAQEIVDEIGAKASQIDSNTDRIESLEDDRYKPYPTDTASGSIASFPDGADGIPLKSCIVQIEPAQDLHGYDHPWPAGGGVNTLDPESLIGQYPSPVYGLAISRYGEWITINGTYSGEIQEPQFRFMGKKDGSTFDDTYWAFPDSNSSNNIPGRTSKADSNKTMTIGLNNMIQGTTYNLRFRLMGTTDTTRPTDYTPYSNICPISGWTEVHPNISGINVWDEEWESGFINNNGENEVNAYYFRTKGYIPIKPNTQYFYKCPTTYSNYGRFRFYGANKAFVSQIGTNIIINNAFTTPENAYYMRFTTGEKVGIGTTYNHDISINYPSTDHDYHPYTGQSINIQLGQTVYGGKLDVLSGVLTVDRAMVDLGTLNWIAPSDDRYYTSSLANVIKKGVNGALWIQSSMFKAVSNLNALYASQNSMFLSENGNISISKFVDSNLVAALTGQQLVYELATPITISLTPHEVTALLGSNNVWADTGDSSVEYRADTKMYIERLTEPDADMIADSNIVSGQYFMVGNSLYLATSNIASGGQVIEGTNCTRKSLATALNEINS